ncbi:hypothetical protein NAI71_10645, partial [Francisella tularensis subsp. holarctica]|nr:hypothetical protein [Francisella tularensis subsp. holarctica]
YDKSINLGFDAYLVHDYIIRWISLNISNPDLNTPSCLVIHSSNQWAVNHIMDNRVEILEIIFERAK